MVPVIENHEIKTARVHHLKVIAAMKNLVRKVPFIIKTRSKIIAKNIKAPQDLYRKVRHIKDKITKDQGRNITFLQKDIMKQKI